MFKKLGTVLCAVAMFSIAGGHWAVLQSVAWTGMVIEYSRDASLTSALSKTFDGKHPCTLCVKIDESKKQEPKPAPALTDKQDKSCPLFFSSCFVDRTGIPLVWSIHDLDATRISHAPDPTPPRV
jgi:hypothetical protein